MKKIERGTGSRCKIEKVGYWRAGKKFDQRDAFGKEQKKKDAGMCFKSIVGSAEFQGEGKVSISQILVTTVFNKGHMIIILY